MNDNSFFSIDRLVEFGLGMAVAQQMINTMNQTIRTMYVPGSIQSMPQPAQSIFYVAIEGKAVGPINDNELLQMVTQKRVDKDTLVWMPGMATWEPMERVPSALKVIALTPPPLNL